MTETVRLGARLRAARKAAGFKTSKEFLKRHKVPASTYSQHESGARNLDDEAIQFYSQVFGVSFNWLKSGKGQPYSKPSTNKKNTMQEELLDLTKLKSRNKLNDNRLKKALCNVLKEHFGNNHALKIEKIAEEVMSLINGSL